jgi:hypothetical protein
MDEDFVVAGMTAGTIERLTGRFASNEFTWLILCTSARMGKAGYLGRGRFRMELLSQKDALDIITREGLFVVPPVDDYEVGGCISGLIEDIAERLGESTQHTWQILYTASQLGRAKYHGGGKFYMERRCIPDVMRIVEREGRWPNLPYLNIPDESEIGKCDCRSQIWWWHLASYTRLASQDLWLLRLNDLPRVKGMR